MKPSLHLAVRELILAEASDNWALVRRCPCTHTWKAVDYLRAAPTEEREGLFDDFLAVAGCFFGDEPSAGIPSPRFFRFHESLMQLWHPDYESLRMRRARAAGGASNFSLSAPKAGEIRKAINLAFGQRYGARPQNEGGGAWRYPGVWGERAFEVKVDYGGWDQLRYEVEYDDPNSGVSARRLSYERLVGVGVGHWDFITTDTLQGSIDVLCEMIERLVALPERVR